jgi:plasmid stabilization system protein ParE
MEDFRKTAAFPNRGHRHREVTIPNVLVYRVSSYLIAYEQETNPLMILRVVHGARDLKRLFRKA